MPGRLTTRCCIVGGGPAGVLLGYLLARAGIEVVVLEKHCDFLRDFRGDTLHPSTLQIMSDLGLLEGLLSKRHQTARHLEAVIGGETYRVASFESLRVRCPYIAFMPQWEFLNFLVQCASELPSFRLIMQAEAVDLIVDGNRIVGVRARTPEGPLSIIADLTIGADGRSSVIRKQA